MTITVSIEELRAFESALQKWHMERAEFIVKRMESLLNEPFANHVMLDRDFLTKYDREHPKPTLIQHL